MLSPLLKKLQPPHNPSGSLNDATFQRIVSAVLATIQGTGPSAPPPSSSSAATELVEMPIVESGSALSQATVPAPVASVLHNITGEANFIQVSPSSQPALPTFHSVNVPIDANVSPKIKTKIWAHEFIDFGILLGSGAGDIHGYLKYKKAFFVFYIDFYFGFLLVIGVYNCQTKISEVHMVRFLIFLKNVSENVVQCFTRDIFVMP